jgi:phosphate starvation-inducible PhoH-like protein
MGPKKTNKSSSKKQPRYLSEEDNIVDNYASTFLKFKNVKLTPKQEELKDIIVNNKIVVATGPAGTSKTFTACYTALQLYNQNFCDKIILCKPTEIVGDTGLGYLKGTLKEKIEVYEESFISNFAEIIDGKDLKMLRENLTIEFKPVQFVRGATFKNSVVIIDEFQSFDIKELMAIVTRLGNRNCKMIFAGDINQNDINRKYVALDIFKEILDGLPEVKTFEFDRKDIVRDPLLIAIVDRYEKMKEDGKIPQTKGNK